MAANKKPFERLPTDVVPTNYRLVLRPDLKLFKFTGTLDVTVDVKKSTNRIVLNSAEIEITSAKCGGQDVTVSYNVEAETVTLQLTSDLAVGETTVSMEYTGILNDQMRGFYRSKYTHPDFPNEERFAGVTQFEAADARRSLPCWDEPLIKATFDVTLVVPKNLVALSNMNETSCEDVEGGLKRVTFARTPIMSTYLLAFIVGEFDYVEGRDSNGVLVRVFTPTGKKENGQYALDVAVKTLPFYATYFDIKYPLPKMDLIAIQDFAAGAMENWGLVTYRERLLLVDPVNSSAFTKQLVALVVGHELAHQWFGNLVTMEWWTHLWLNEGFATWIEYLCVDHTHPEFEIWTNFLSREYASALNLDALDNSHPIEIEVGPPSEVEEIFDTISYAKGSCIIRMLHDWIGTENFQKGLGSYLKKFAYKNARTEDLWASLEEASKQPVATVMNTWTKQMGYPVLTVEGKQDGNNRILTISQKKFCANGENSGDESVLWQVPITIATSKNPAAVKVLLEGPSTTVTVEGVGQDDWILVNPCRQGFYRVSYSATLLSPILSILGQLSAQDRLGLLNDTFALARAGVGSTVDVLRLIGSFVNETSYTVWESLASNMGSLARLFSYTDCFEDFKKFALKLLAPTFARLGWDSKDTDSTLDTMLRSLVIGQLGRYGDPDMISESKRRFNDHVSEKDAIPVDIKSAVFSATLGNGDETIFNQLVALHDKADSNEEKVRIYASLGNGKTDTLITKCIDFATSDKVRPQDLPAILMSLTRCSPNSRERVWQFMQENWTMLKERYSGQFLLARMIDVSTAGFVSEERAVEIEKFFSENPWPMAARIVKQNCEAIRLNAKWLQRDRDIVKEWLASQ